MDRIWRFAAVVVAIMLVLGGLSTVVLARWVTLVLALSLWVVSSAPGQSSPSPDSIRRLAPSAFPKLPIEIRRDLETRGCRVPQPWDETTSANVIHGSFTTARANEWAVLCSARDTSQILVYRAGGGTAIDSLQRAADLGWMQGVGGVRWGYSRLLQVRPLRMIRAWRHDIDGHTIPQPVDHDAIEQAFEGKAAEAFYFAAGRWHRQVTAD